MAKTDQLYMPPTPYYSVNREPKTVGGPVVGTLARGDCELRRAGSSTIVDKAGNITEYRAAPVATVESLTAEVGALRAEISGVRAQISTLATQLGVKPAQVRNVAEAPAFMAPVPYFDS